MASPPPAKRCNFLLLPENCITYMLSLTSPKDACSSAAVCSVFREAVDSDLVWNRFLPSDCSSILRRSVSPVEYRTKKELFKLLAFSPILIDNGRKSFWLDMKGRNRCMLSAKELTVEWGQWEQDRWKCRWVSSKKSRFGETLMLQRVSWLHICTRINLEDLTPNTNYAAYLVLKICGPVFPGSPVRFEFGTFGEWLRTVSVMSEDGCYVSEQECSVHTDEIIQTFVPTRDFAFVRKRQWSVRRPRGRELLRPSHSQCREEDSNWMEIEVGEFLTSNRHGQLPVDVKMASSDSNRWLGDLMLLGLEIRPKS